MINPKPATYAPAPLIEPGHTFGSITDKIGGVVLGGRTPLSWFIVVSIGLMLMGGMLGLAIDLAADQGHRHLGRQPAGRLGLRDHQLRLVDRHRPRRHADLGDPAAAQAGMAHVDQPLRRRHDDLRGHVRGHVPAHPHRPSVARGLLAVPVSEQHGRVAAVPQPADLGRLRGLDLLHGLAAVLVRRADSRPGDAARQGEASGR